MGNFLPIEKPLARMEANKKVWVSLRVFLMVMIMVPFNSAALSKDSRNLNVGVIVDPTTRNGKEQMFGIEIAVEDFTVSTSNKGVNIKLSLHFGNSSSSNPLQAAYSAIELIKEKKVDVIIGAAETWQETTLLAEVGNEHKVPILSLATPTSVKLLQWPTLVKMNMNLSAQISCIASLIKFHGWRRVIAVYEDDGYDAHGIFWSLDLLSQTLQDFGSEIEFRLALPPFASMSNPKEVITQQMVKVLGTQSRVFVVLHASLPVAIHLFREASNMGLVGRESAWITTDSIASFLDTINASDISSMEGILGVKTYYDEYSDNFKDFRNKFFLKFLSQYPKEIELFPGIHALKAYDAIKPITKTLKGLRYTTDFSHKFMQEMFSLQFNGLSGNISFKNGELEEYGGLIRIVNVVGKKYKELDFWTPKRGFFERLGDEVEASESASQVFRGSVNWPGNVKNVPKGWEMPTNAKPLKIGVPGRTVFEKFVKVENGGNPNRITYSGFCIDAFLEIVKILEESYAFPYEFEAFNGTYNELVECVHNKTYDAVVGDVTILADRAKHVEFTQPYSKSGLSMIVPLKSEDSQKAWMFMKPFSWTTWLATFATLYYTMFVVWFIERRNNSDFGGSLINQLSVALWFTFSSLFFAQREKIESNYARITVVGWLFVVFVLTSSYTASLTSILTVPLLEPKVKDINRLIKTNSIVGCDGDSFVLEYLVSVLGFKPENIRNVSSEYSYPELLSNGSIAAAFIEYPYAKVFFRQYCKDFTETKQNYRLGGQGFVFQKGSPLVPDVSKAILKLSENGILKQLNDKWFSPSSECSSSSKTDIQNERLGIQLFWLLYVFSGFISTLCFLLLATRWFKRIRKLFPGYLNLTRNSSFLNKMVQFAEYLKRGEDTSTTPQTETPLGHLHASTINPSDPAVVMFDNTSIRVRNPIPISGRAQIETRRLTYRINSI